VRSGVLTSGAPREQLVWAWRRGRTLALAVPVWFWLASLVALSASIRLELALQDPAPWIFQDEIAYSELAKTLAATGAFGMRDIPGLGGFGPAYPAIIAPAFALFDGVPNGYEAAKATNALVMSLVAVPTYLLARRLVGPGLAFVAAALSLSVPSMVYTTTLMTENAFYPALMACALGIVLVLERPTLLRHLLLAGCFLTAYVVRAQAVTVLAAFVTAVGLVVVSEAWAGRRWPSLRVLGQALVRFRITWIGLAAGAALLVALQIARGQRLTALLGAYEGVRSFDYSREAVARWFLYHIGALDIYVGVLPFAALLMLAILSGGSGVSAELRAFVAASVSLVLWMSAAVAAFASSPLGQRIEERNLFHVAPLFLVAVVVWVGLRLPRPWLPASAAFGLSVALAALVPDRWLLQDTTVHSAPGLLPLRSLEEATSVGVPVLLVLGAAAVSVLAYLLPRRFSLVLPAVVLAYLATANFHAEGFTTDASKDSLRGGIVVRPDWIDRRLGANADVTELYPGGSPVPFWESEFFNHSVGRVFNLTGQHDSLPQQNLVADPESGALKDVFGIAPIVEYVLTNRWTVIDGEEIDRDPLIGMVLLRVEGPIFLRERIDGLYADFWSGPGVGYMRAACRGGSLTVAVTSDPDLFPRGQLIVASVGGGIVRHVRGPPDGGTHYFSLPLAIQNGQCGVIFSVSPTAVPAQVLGTPDMRELGIRFTEFTYEPPI
jgi:hypothetical protein